MAVDTPPDVRSLVIYQVFPRNHGPTGTLPDITADLDRIVDLGADVLFLMPIHPIGVDGRKGSEGSPYAISDYRVLHPDLGTDEDFDDLVSAAHEAGLKVIIDVVFNHTVAGQRARLASIRSSSTATPTVDRSPRFPSGTTSSISSIPIPTWPGTSSTALPSGSDGAWTGSGATWLPWCRWTSGPRRAASWRGSGPGCCGSRSP